MFKICWSIILFNFYNVFAGSNPIIVRVSCADNQGYQDVNYWYLEETVESDTLREFEKFVLSGNVYKVYPFHIALTQTDFLLACEFSHLPNALDYRERLSELGVGKDVISHYQKLYEGMIDKYGNSDYDIFFSKNCFKISDGKNELTFVKLNIDVCKSTVFTTYPNKYTNIYAIPRKVIQVDQFDKQEKEQFKKYSSDLLKVKLISDFSACK